LTVASVEGAQPRGFRSFIGQAPPELVVDGAEWINADGPMTLKSLRGKAVWVEFSFVDCSGCQIAKALIKEWHKRFEDKGLTIVEVNNGEIDTIDKLRAGVREHGVKHAVLWDKGARTIRRYGVGMYPTGYILDRSGKVIWEGHPTNLSATEQIELIEKALQGGDDREARNVPAPSIHRAALADEVAAEDKERALPCCDLLAEDKAAAREDQVWGLDSSEPQQDQEEEYVSIVNGAGEVLWEGHPDDMPEHIAKMVGANDLYEPFEDDAYLNGEGPTLTMLADSIDSLVEHFNSQRDKKRFVALLSATCPACIFGARAVRDSILESLPDEEFGISIVWIDMLPGDKHAAALRSAHLFNDPRVKQFYDPNRIVGMAFAEQLLNENAGPAWDIYMVFDKGASWNDAAPIPVDWCHQLSGKRRADPERFRTGEELVQQLGDFAGRWLRAARGEPRRPFGKVQHVSSRGELELLYVKDCPNHPVLLERLEEALARCGLKRSIKETNLAELPESDTRRRFGSPSVLFNGSDLFGCAPNSSGALTCRIYEGGSVPASVQLCAALCDIVYEAPTAIIGCSAASCCTGTATNR
jgi:peroxiredoxin